ncbi:t-SNARE VTI1 [Savitreella phatthalungensis]
MATERFTTYEEDLQLVLTELQASLDSASSLKGEARKKALSSCDRSLDEARELVGSLELELQEIPTAQRADPNRRVREARAKADSLKRAIAVERESGARRELFGGRGANGGDDPFADTDDASHAQRQRLLRGTDTLERTSDRLTNAQRLANETENVGAGILGDLRIQGEQLRNTRDRLSQADTNVDRSLRTLKVMGRRLITNKLITGSIIALLVLLILLVLYSKFR